MVALLALDSVAGVLLFRGLQAVWCEAACLGLLVCIHLYTIKWRSKILTQRGKSLRHAHSLRDSDAEILQERNVGTEGNTRGFSQSKNHIN